MTLVSLLKRTFVNWKKLVLPLAGLQFLSYLPAIFSAIYLGYRFPTFDFTDLNAEFPDIAVVLFTISFIIQFVFLAFVFGVAYKAALEVAKGHPIVWSQIFRTAKQYWIRIICASIVIGLAAVFGLLLLIIPGILVLINSFLLLPSMVDEDLTTFPAWNRSKALLLGARWRILGYIIAINVIVATPSVVLSFFVKDNLQILVSSFIMLFMYSLECIFITELYLARKSAQPA